MRLIPTFISQYKRFLYRNMLNVVAILYVFKGASGAGL